MFNLAGKRPSALGIQDGRFVADATARNNRVSSMLDPRDADYIPAFTADGDRADVMTRLIAVLLERTDCSITTQQADYIHAEFKSRLMGLVDDAEFYLAPQEPLLHVRAASRLAHPDAGLNRARLEEVREAFDDAD